MWVCIYLNETEPFVWYKTLTLEILNDKVHQRHAILHIEQNQQFPTRFSDDISNNLKERPK